MPDALEDYVHDDPERQAALLRAALEADDQATAPLAQGIILRQNVTQGYVERHGGPPPNARGIMMGILQVLGDTEKARVPFRVMFAAGSVAAEHYDPDVRKAAADLLVRWAVPKPPD